MAGGTIRVRGYRETMRAFRGASRQTRKVVRERLKSAAEPVRAEAEQRFRPVDAGSAAGFRVAVRSRGVAVEQPLKRTTGKRPDFGAMQMRDALIPALDVKSGEVERKLDKALDEIADYFDRV